MRYFKIEEFDSPDLQGSGFEMDKTFLSMIDNARSIAKIPFKINSGFRTHKRNRKVGGKINSSHLKGLAADISVTDSVSRFIVLNALKDVGFTRIGIAETFIHCDIDTTKTQKVIWVY